MGVCVCVAFIIKSITCYSLIQSLITFTCTHVLVYTFFCHDVICFHYCSPVVRLASTNWSQLILLSFTQPNTNFWFLCFVKRIARQRILVPFMNPLLRIIYIHYYVVFFTLDSMLFYMEFFSSSNEWQKSQLQRMFNFFFIEFTIQCDIKAIE